MKCCYISDRETEELCGEPEAEVYCNLPLCGVHKDAVRLMYDSKARANPLLASKYHDLSAFPGICYIALLPDGFVKIGFSNTDELFSKRMRSLSSDYGAPVIPLITLPGGFVAEAVLHDRFKNDRQSGNGERFRYSPEMAEYIAHEKARQSASQPGLI
ncbi:hypothetical protein SEA_KANELY_1 [Mycobacterium phage Kanely]|nr:hypothetical protein SEA_KANELY_1 [Mycobacterium phage Kanely]WAB09857.1 hypothetical protein PBI_ALTMAN_1 [Mycobacterium phage Altman]